MTFHIGAARGDIAPTVLMPGDPLRAEWAAKTYLQDAVCVNRTRGMFGFTGTWRGNPVTIQASGMGMPSMSIYANELIRDFDVQTLVRVGSCGAMQPDVAIRDIVIAMSTTTVSTPSRTIFRELAFAPTPDYDLLAAAVTAARARDRRAHVGCVYSSDTFYDERPDLNEEMRRHGVLAVEMEAAELYILALRYQRRALAIFTVSDHLLTKEALPAEDRERTFGEMIEVALEAAFS